MGNDLIKAAREAAGLSQREAASALGVSRYAFILTETHSHALPRGLTDKDALDAIARLSDRSRLPETPQEVLP